MIKMTNCNQSLHEAIVAHDYFAMRGGGERLVLTAANALNAKLLYGYRTNESYELGMFPARHQSLNLPGFLQRPTFRLPFLALNFLTSQKHLRGYPIRIYSGASAPFAAKKAAGVKNIYYCHTPPRFLYDQRKYFSDSVNKNPIGRIMLKLYQQRFERSLDEMDVILANSNNVQNRIRKYLGRDSIIVYPPCDTRSFKWIGEDGFYLSTARLSPLKQVDKIVKAFMKMPKKRLVVASGGPELPRLKVMAENSPNISFLGWISEQQMQDLVGRAIATIYVPIDEDFGMSPVESMAAGKPVVGVAEGGLTETIIDGQTGILMPPSFTAEDICSAVEIMSPRTARTMRAECEYQAQRFDEATFVSRLREIVDMCSAQL
jgi:glycosyltransferase involved in cell wall biosynthesis